jgi:D-lactate dehydrogenase (cytochrome)
MRENILALNASWLDAETVVRAGTHALKSSAGYDLVSLMRVRGTCVITSVTVKLHPIPEHVVAAVCALSRSPARPKR